MDGKSAVEHASGPATTPRPAAGRNSAAARIAAVAMRPPALALAAYLTLSLLVYATVVAAPDTRLIGPTGDPQQSVWFLNWTPYALIHGHNPLLSDWVAAPDGVNLMWNTSMPLPGLILWPVTATLGATVAYNVLVVAGIALSAWCAFLAARRYVRHQLAAFTGGLFYGFSPFLVVQSLGHPDISVALLPPLALLLLDEILVRQRRSSRAVGISLGLLAAAQVLVFEEVLVLVGIAAVAAVAVLAVQHRDRVSAHSRHVLAALGWAFAVFIPLAAWPLVIQLFGPHGIRGTVQPSNLYVNDLLGFVIPTGASLIAPRALTDISAQFSGNIIESGAYLGLPLLVLCVVAATRFWDDAAVRVLAISALVIAVLSLGPSLHVAGRDTGIPLPWRAVEAVPFVGDTLPSRMSLCLNLLVGVLLAVGVDRVVLRPRATRLAVAGAVLSLVVVCPLVPLPTTEAATPRFFADDARRIPQGSVALIAPFARDFHAPQAMLWQVVAGMRFRMPEGYVLVPGPSGNAIAGPPRTPLSDAMVAIAMGSGAPADRSAAARTQLGADLERWQVATVVVGPMEHRAEMVDFLAWLLGRQPVEDQGVQVWWDAELNRPPPAR
jgi:hypothetical protein